MKFLVLAICSILWVLGGQIKGRIRDSFVPPIIALTCALSIWSLWNSLWIFILMSGTGQSIRMGYGNWDPDNDPKPSFLAAMTHDRNGWWIRAIWGFLTSTAIGLPLVLFGYLSILWYVVYVVVNVLINFGVSKLRLAVYPTDIIVSLGLTSIIFLTKVSTTS